MIDSVFSVLYPYLFLGLAYLCFFPLFIEQDKGVVASLAIAATTLGTLSAGLIYTIFGALGLNAEYWTVGLFLLAAIINLLAFRGRSRPSLNLPRWSYLIGIGIVFLVFGGTSLVAHLVMGGGAYPEMFFNYDSPLRLAHTQQLIEFRGPYPPNNLYMEGSRYSYHFGAPAAAAFLSTLTNITPHKALFHFIAPLMIIGSFASLYFFLTRYLNQSALVIIALALFNPNFFYFDEVVYIFSNGLESVIPLSKSLLLGAFGIPEYQAEYLGKGVSDPSISASYFLVLFGLALLATTSRTKMLLTSILVIPLVGFTKANYLSAVGAGYVARGFKGLRKPSAVGTILIAITAGLALALLVTFQGYNNPGISGSTISFTDTFSLSSIFLNFFSDITNPKSIQFSFVCGVILFVFLIGAQKFGFLNEIKFPDQISLLIFGWIFVYSVGTFLVVELIDATQIGQLRTSAWLIAPLLATVCLRYLAAAKSLFRWTLIALLVPVLLVGLATVLARAYHSYIIVFSPSLAHEVIDTRSLAPALQTIPREGSLVVTNQLTHPAFWLANPPISALFGHRAYSAYFDGPVKLGKIEALLQLRTLSSRFRRSLPDAVKETLAISAANGWTHFVFHKHSDQIRESYNMHDGSLLPPRDAEDVPLTLLFENSDYAIFKF